MAAIKCEHGRLRWRCVECGGHEGTFDALQSRSLCSHEPPAVPAAFDVVLHAANVASSEVASAHRPARNAGADPRGGPVARIRGWTVGRDLLRTVWRHASWHLLITGRRRHLICLQFALLLVVGLCLGLGLRLGPTGLMASGGVQEGEKFVDCAADQQHAGKLLVHLMRARGLPQGVSPYGKLNVGGSLKDTRFSRLGWNTLLNEPTHRSDSSPDWGEDGMRWVCLDKATLQSIMSSNASDAVQRGRTRSGDGQSSVRIEVWRHHSVFGGEVLGAADLHDLVQQAVAGFGVSRMYSSPRPLVLRDAGGAATGGSAEVGVKFYPSADLEDALLPMLLTGDVVLFSGDTYSGRMIKALTDSEYSHIGLVSAEEGREITVMEASTNLAGLPDCDGAGVVSGVERLGLIDKVFSGFYDRVSVRLLVYPGEELVISQSSPQFSRVYQDSEGRVGRADAPSQRPARRVVAEKLEAFYEAHRGKPYEQFDPERIGSALEFRADGWSDKQAFFCSEFTAAAFLTAGLWQTSVSASYAMPEDFSSDGSGETDGYMAQTARLSNEVYLRRPQRFGKGRCFEAPSSCQCSGPQAVPYSNRMACLQGFSCSSLFQFWLGSEWDSGLGLDLEIFCLCVACLWLLACCTGNSTVLCRFHKWRSSRRKIDSWPKGQWLLA